MHNFIAFAAEISFYMLPAGCIVLVGIAFIEGIRRMRR